MEPTICVVGLGGSLRTGSTRLAALRITLEAAAKAGASTRLLDLNELDLPMYRPGMDATPTPPSGLGRRRLAERAIPSAIRHRSAR